MTASIDKKIVEMSFENDKFEKGVGTSLNSIDKLKKSLNFDGVAKSFDGISSAANRVNLGSIAEGVQGISNRFSAMGVLAITTLVNIANSAYQAGVRIAKALTIDPIKTGLNEYETKLNSVQTILANTQKEGTNLEVVTKALNDLNEYSDKTIYNFQQMTRNVGTFTAAGVKLDTSVAAIKGIANLAAISGSNADQASTAMYQLSQALSSGTVKLMDWNSVVNAGMGGQVFQEAIKETARLHGVGIDQMIEKEGSFRETLQKGWFTSEILTETLAKFTGDLNEDQLRTMGYTQEQIAGILKMGQTANDAATKVKTFTQLFDTLKEAAQSGWAQTWEVIIGNFDEAKEFLTQLNNQFGAILSSSADARNSMLTGWKDLGGRTKLIEAFQNALNAVLGIVNPLKSAFRDIFPATTAQQLFNITDGLSKFAKGLILSSENSEKVRRIFKGVFAVLDIGKIAISALLKALFGLVGSFSDTGTSLLDLTAKFSDWLVKLRESVIKSEVFTIIFQNIAKVLKSVIDGIGDFFGALIGGFSDVDKISKSEALSNFLETLGEKFRDFGKFGIIISKVFNVLSKLAAKLGPIVGKIASKIGDVVNKALDFITEKLEKLDVNKALEVLNTGLFGGILLGIKGFVDDSKKLVGTGLFGGILLSIKSFIDEGGSVFTGVKGILDGVKDSLKSYQKTLKAETLYKIAGAMALLAASILVLSFIDSERLLAATGAMSAMFIGLMGTLNVFEKTTGSGAKLVAMTGAIIGISGSLLVLALAVTVLSKLDPAEAAQGVLAIGSILGLLTLFQKFSTASTGLIGAVAGIFALSLAMMAIGFAIKSLGNMETETLIKGLLTMGAILGIVSVSLSSMTAAMPGAAALLVASGAILVLAISLKALGSLSLEQIGIGLLAIAGTLTILGIAGALLTPVAPTIAIIAISLLAIGAAAGAFGLAILGIGVGLGALAVGIVTLAGLSSVGIATITVVITSLASLLPLIAKQIAIGITNLIITLGENAIKIGKAIANIGLEILKSFAELIPEVVNVVLKFVLTLLTKLEESVPEIVDTGAKLLIGILEGMRSNIGEIVTLAAEVIINFINALKEKLPELNKAGWDFIISFIDSLALSMEEEAPRLAHSLRELALSIIKGILTGLSEGREDLWNGVKEVGQVIIDAFKDMLGINSPSTVFIQFALDIINGLVNGIANNINLIRAKAIEMAKTLIDTVKERSSDLISTGRDFVSGFALGIKDYIGEAIASAREMAQSVINTVANTLQAHSPARALIPLGRAADEGLALGITKFSGKVVDATNSLGLDTISGFKGIVSKITDALNTNMDVAPSIRPVLDLTEIKNAGLGIDSLLSGKTVSANLASITASNVAEQSIKEPLTIDPAENTKPSIQFTQINNSPKELSRSDIYRQTRIQLLSAKGLAGDS